MRKLALLLLLLAPLAVFGQGIVSIPPQQCVWRAGDNPGWAAPSLDQSGWQPYAEGGFQLTDPHIWVRCHADLSPLRGLARPAIQVSMLAAYQLFVNGQPVGAAGSLRSGDFSENTIRSFPLPEPLLQHAVIALRITYRYIVQSEPVTPGPLKLNAGDEGALRDWRASAVLQLSSRSLMRSVYYGMIGVFGVVLLGMFLYDRSRSEVLLLSIACLSVAAIYMAEAATFALADYSAVVLTAIFSVAMVVTGVAQPWFFFRLAGRRVPLLFWLLIGLAVQDHALLLPLTFLPVAPALRLAAFYGRWAAPVGFAGRIAPAFAPFVAFWPYSRISRRIRPLAILCMVWGANMVLFFYIRMTSLHILGLPDLEPRWGSLVRNAEPITTLCLIAALMGLLFRDQRQVAEERALLAGEVQAARHVQQYLIPEHVSATPGLAIESEYRPAREVGGDFFQVLPQPADGNVLIVIGDVAGKGVEAGMLATLIVGAVRTAAAFTSDPERILALLNERLQGRGLVTCLALRIERDGNAILVNAGHLPPYLNGKELGVEGALPLGAVPGIEFPVSRFKLAAGDRLLLMTDGVAEAQNPQGRLFGFERIGELLRTGASGAALAAAAQSFGQEDDITVLTVTRLAEREQPAALRAVVEPRPAWQPAETLAALKGHEFTRVIKPSKSAGL